MSVTFKNHPVFHWLFSRSAAGIAVFGMIFTLLLIIVIVTFPAPGISGEKKTDAHSARIIAENPPFVLMSSGVVVDKQRNLMWAQSDNRSKISIDQAKIYVKDFSLAGFTDWRIPDIQELESLMVRDSPNDTAGTDGCSGNYEIHNFFELTCC